MEPRSCRDSRLKLVVEGEGDAIGIHVAALGGVGGRIALCAPVLVDLVQGSISILVCLEMSSRPRASNA